MKTEEIKDLIPEDFKKHASRDLSAFASSILGETYVKSFHEIFGFGFSSTLWIVNNGNFTTLFRSEKEHQNFREQIGKKSIEKKFAFNLAKKLRAYTDWINYFIKEKDSYGKFLYSKDKFVKRYMDWFAYHQAVYWASHYLHEEHPEMRDIVEELDSAYEYNEKVVPDVEVYLKELGLTNYAYYDLENPVTDIGFMFFIYGKIKGPDIKEIEEFIKSKEKQDFSNIKEIKGMMAHKKSVKGKVKVIKDFYKLGEIQPDEILVAEMSRPQFNETIAKCKGIITDEGGMLCHASILAREAEIPCIVGTEIATKVLKDGDFVEIDAENSLVKILEEKNG